MLSYISDWESKRYDYFPNPLYGSGGYLNEAGSRNKLC